MRRIAASIVFPVSSPPRSNAVVEIDQNGTVVSVSRGGASFREIAGVEYFSGILVPGLADVMCGQNESGHSLLAGGVRVAGRAGWPEDRDGSHDPPPDQSTAPGECRSPKADKSDLQGGASQGGKFPAAGEPRSPDRPSALPQQMVPGTNSVTWRNRYGGTVGYTIYTSMDHFHQYFRKSEISDVFLFNVPEGDLEVLAGQGRTGLLELMLALQDGPCRYSLTKLLTMATLNGALASGYRGEAGSLSPGMRPGLNIIEGVDIGKMRLLPVSRIRRLY